MVIVLRFHITKYPTLKIIRNGQPSKKEYRGQRSAEAFTKFIKSQLEDPVKEFGKLNDLDKLESDKRIIIGEYLKLNISFNSSDLKCFIFIIIL